MSKPHRRALPSSAVLMLAAAVAVAPMLAHGPSCGHDFDFHLLSWLEAASQFAHLGAPHWAFTPAFNAGEPRFIFYPPLSWTLGAILGLLLPWTAVPIALTWIALSLSGLTLYRVARRYAPAPAALLAATLYLGNPYMLFTAYERTAYGELLAAAWLPLLFAAMLEPRLRVLRVAVPVALLWLTNAPAAVMGSYLLALLALYRLWAGPHGAARVRSRLRMTSHGAGGVALGMGLASFYLLPAIVERRFIQASMAVIEGMRPADHFLFHRMAGHTPDSAFHDQVVRTASIVALTVLAGIALALLAALRRADPPRPAPDAPAPDAPAPGMPAPDVPAPPGSAASPPPPLWLLGGLALLIAFLLTPLSLLVWLHVPQLIFLQFPWRLTALLGVILGIATALALRRLPPLSSLQTAAGSLMLAVVLVAPAWALFHQSCDESDAVPARTALFYSPAGTEATDEYTPADADADALKPQDPPWWLAPSVDRVNDPPPPSAEPGQAPAHLTLTLPAAGVLILNRRAFPGWTVTLNHAPAPATLKRSDGLIALPLPAGDDTVDLRYRRTPDQIAGLAVSLLALAVAVALARPPRRKRPRDPGAGSPPGSGPGNRFALHSTCRNLAEDPRMPNQPGLPPTLDSLTNIPRLITAFYALQPDAAQPAQRVAFGTSGHRGNAFLTSFNDRHIAAISQAIVDYRTANKISGPLFLAQDTHALSDPAFSTALEVLAANDVEVMVDSALGYTPTPALSHAILSYNDRRVSNLADGIVITPSHNPPEDGGFKYNPPNGGPADTGATKWIENRANDLIAADLKGVKRIPYGRALLASTTHRHDFLTAYVDDLAHVIDFDALQNSRLKLAVDPLGGAGVFYWPRIIDQYNLPVELLNPNIDPTFRFMTCDWDGKVRMDCSSPNAMASMIAKKDSFDVAWACDTDHDRHGIVTRSSGLLNPNHYLAVAIQYLFTHRPEWGANVGIGKTLVSSSMIDRVAKGLNRPMLEVPVGFKWFVDGLIDGSLGFVGEESAGATFLRRNGKVWTTDKDGLILGLLAAEMTAVTGKDPGLLYADLTAKYGAPVYQRIDAAATKDQKAKLGKLSPSQVTATALAGDPITSILTEAPGNKASIGGLKVTTAEGWFAARPSGTEDVYKIYAESFKGADHLKQIQTEAQTLVTAAIA